MLHGQGIRDQPRDLLGQIPHVQLLEAVEAGVCCGSAGIYNLVEPEVVAESDLTDRNDLPVLGTLVAALQLGSAQALVTGNKALLALRDRYPIRTPAEFWAEHGGP